MIRIDPMYKTLHLVDFKIINTNKLIRLKEKGIVSIKESNLKIYIDKPLDYKGRINEKHLSHIIRIRNFLIKGIKEIQKELKLRGYSRIN